MAENEGGQEGAPPPNLDPPPRPTTWRPPLAPRPRLPSSFQFRGTYLRQRSNRQPVGPPPNREPMGPPPRRDPELQPMGPPSTRQPMGPPPRRHPERQPMGPPSSRQPIRTPPRRHPQRQPMGPPSSRHPERQPMGPPSSRQPKGTPRRRHPERQPMGPPSSRRPMGTPPRGDPERQPMGPPSSRQTMGPPPRTYPQRQPMGPPPRRDPPPSAPYHYYSRRFRDDKLLPAKKRLFLGGDGTGASQVVAGAKDSLPAVAAAAAEEGIGGGLGGLVRTGQNNPVNLTAPSDISPGLHRMRVHPQALAQVKASDSQCHPTTQLQADHPPTGAATDPPPIQRQMPSQASAEGSHSDPEPNEISCNPSKSGKLPGSSERRSEEEDDSEPDPKRK